jgi:general secretion pathway protein I
VKHRRGFTLLEVMVATTIMGIAVAALVTGITGAVRGATKLNEYGHAAQLLVDPTMPRNVAIAGEFDPLISGGVHAGWQARLSTFEMPPASIPGTSGLDRIELQIWWMSGATRRTFNLDGYRTRVLKPEDFPPPGAPQ